MSERRVDLRLESFEAWLDRQIRTASKLHSEAKASAKKRRYWDQFLLLQGIKAEYERRIMR